MVIPSDTVIKAIGAGGYPAALVGMFAFAAFLAATLLGLHNPLQHTDTRSAACSACSGWPPSLSYVLMDRSALTVAETAGADRLLMQLAVITGVVAGGRRVAAIARATCAGCCGCSAGVVRSAASSPRCNTG